MRKLIHNFSVVGANALAMIFVIPLIILFVIGNAADRALTWIGRLLERIDRS